MLGRSEVQEMEPILLYKHSEVHLDLKLIYDPRNKMNLIQMSAKKIGPTKVSLLVYSQYNFQEDKSKK